MNDFEETTVVTLAPKPKARAQARRKKQPPYHVILWDSDQHTFDYVIGMLQTLFGHPRETGFKMAYAVHTTGKAVVFTTTRERAELKRDQIHAFGKDKLTLNCQGSMHATIEPAE